MTENMSMLEFLRQLLTDPQMRGRFAQDPQAALADHGLCNLDARDVHDAVVLNQDNQTADFSRHGTGDQPAFQLPALPPAPVLHGGESTHEAAVRYLNSYVTNNHIDSRSTTIDNSINQQVDTHGGDVDQHLDMHSVTASGDGAVASGGAISGSTVTTGHDNQIGSGNVRGDGNVIGDHNHAVTGNHDTTAFGQGAATSTTVGGHVDLGHGAAFGSGGAAVADNSDHSLHDVGNTSTDNSVNDSFNDSSDHGVHDSGNIGVDASTHDSNNDSSEHHTDTSFLDHNEETTEIDHSLHDISHVIA